MNAHQIFSRRTDATVDFRPDVAEGSPSYQLRRLASYLHQNVAPVENIEDCADAVNYLREYRYRKIFTGTSHDEFVALDERDPTSIDWLLAVHEVETEYFRSSRDEKRNR